MHSTIKRKMVAFALFALVGAAIAQVSPWTVKPFSPVTMTATGQTSAVVPMLSPGTGTGNSFSSGSITVTGTGLVTATFAVMGSTDYGANYFPLPLSPIATPGTTALTQTVTSSGGVYQVNLATITNVKFVTSGTFTATSLQLLLSASPNGSVSRGGGGGGGGAVTAASIMTALGTPPGLAVVGDSIGAATGAPNLSLGYASLIRNPIGGLWNNYSVPGDQCIDSSKTLFSNVNPPSTPSSTLIECGTNDTTNYNSDANKQLVFKRLIAGNYLQALIPLTSKKYAQACTKTTGFATNDNTFITGMAASTILSGDVLTCATNTGPNGAVALAYLITNAGIGTFTVSINGTPQTDPIGGTNTFSSFGDGGVVITGTTSGNTKGFAGVVFTGFAANSTVSVVITSTAASTVAAPVEIAWTAGIPASPNTNVAVVSPNHQNNANDALSGVYAGFESAEIAVLQGLGFSSNLTYANTRDALGTNFAAYFVDAIHPNKDGHALMASTILAAVPQLITNAPPNLQSGPSSVFPANAIVPQTPFQFWSPNPYNLGNGTDTWAPGIRWFGASGNTIFSLADAIHGFVIAGPQAGGNIYASFCGYAPASLYPARPDSLTLCPFTVSGNGILDMSKANQILVPTIASVHGNAVASGTSTNGQRLVFHVTGTAAIDTFTLPSAWGATYGGCINLIPDGAWTTTTAGNIAVASTAIVGKVLTECWDGTKWYPSY